MTDQSQKRSQPLEPRGDNVGQSGRRKRAGEDEAAKRYGNEERWHSSEHPQGTPAEPEHRAPNPESLRRSPYEGRSATPQEGEDEQHGDDKSRYPSRSYAEAGGKSGGDQPKHPGKRWKDQGGAGHGEQYGVGRDGKK